MLLGTPAPRAPMHALLPQLPPSDWLASNELAFAVRAPSPICSGHVMVAVRRPVASYADTTAPERVALWALVDEVELRGLRIVEEPHRGSRGVADAAPGVAATTRVVDLSHPIRAGLVTYPGLPAPTITPHLTREASRAKYAPG